MIINYKKQVLIINVKANMQCSIYYVSLKKMYNKIVKVLNSQMNLETNLTPI